MVDFCPVCVLGALSAVKAGDFSYVNEFDVLNTWFCIWSKMRFIVWVSLNTSRHTSRSPCTRSNLAMVVVLKREGRMFFAIMVKSPGKEDEVFKSENPSGQLWSYLYAMKQLGIEQPMGAIMTYDKMVQVTLDDCGTDERHMSAVSYTHLTLPTKA